METQQPTGGRTAAGALELVRAFVNTNDVESGTDALDDAAALHRFLTEQGSLGPRERVTEDDRARAIELREAIRDLLLANAGHGEVRADAIETLNRAAGRARLVVRFSPDGSSRLEPDAHGCDAALGRLLSLIAGAMTDGTWPRLKACPSDACRWAFYDASKNGSRRWCSMRVCGNREKVKAFRQRHGASD